MLPAAGACLPVLLVLLAAAPAAAQLQTLPPPVNPLLPPATQPVPVPSQPQSTGPQAAGELPDYDVRAQCEQASRFGGSLAQTMYASCIEQEQAAYDALKRVWASLPEAVRTQCDQITRVGGASGSFVMLKTCVEVQQMAPAPPQQQPQFRRW